MREPPVPAGAAGRRRRRGRALLRGAVLPLALLLAWWGVYATGLTESRFYAPPGEVVQTAWRLAGTPVLWTAIGASLLRALAGFALGGALGVLVGVLLGTSRHARRLLGPTLNTLRQVSLFAWIPIIIIWFGLDEASKVVFIAIAAFFPVMLNTVEGVAGIPREVRELARALTCTPAQTFLRFILPGAAASIFSGAYTALVRVWGAAIAAEYMMTSGPGLGRLLLDGLETSAMDLVIVGVLLAGLIGFGLHFLASRFESHLLRWRQ
nr:ABC transporter permease [Luteimonas sp. Y-2-2-4F]